MDLSDSQLDRYARHIVLREIGGEGQRKLLGAHIVVIGAGGIGSPALQYLAAAGVGRLTIAKRRRRRKMWSKGSTPA
jgi:adenylyltransferase/sulfurtransferase